jgi:tetratricopeptide (TPR) repeat protein
MIKQSLVSRLHQATILSCAFSILSATTLAAVAADQKTAADPATLSGTSKAAGAPSAVQASSTAPAADATSAAVQGSSTSPALDATSAAIQAASSPSAVIAPVTPSTEKILLKPGQPLSLNMAADDLVPTDNVELARQQVLAFPDSAEASFILAVAMSRTSRVEDALKEVRRARRLAEAAGGAAYFDKMIASYEEMLKSYPDDNRVRYGLAWAYYMKAYLIAQKHPKDPNVPAVSDNSPVSGPQASHAKTPQNWMNNAAAGQVLGMLSPQLANKVPNAPGALPTAQLPHIPGALEKASPAVVPQIKQYYELAIKNLDDLLTRTPDDIWARVYRAHLAAEFTGNIEDSMNVWRACQKQAPQNPAPYFFLGEGYLKQGNLKECLNNISRAIALRAVGN